ncbi:hypothetical protein HDK64DRAFT_62682 [Phyllosticta capitalensis]|uniref:Uncharacterized protein n=1 Tax=Phyllosticta capitalensis TaxID=121624 RepID=A0ABR1Z552_9PEZI
MPGDDSVLSETVYYYTSTLTYAFIAASASLLLLALMLFPTAVLRWLQRKRYQYEVTFSLYMLTPTEKFIFNSFLFLFLSMIVIAASLYLPEHISFLADRALYYLSGDHPSSAAAHLASTAAAAAAESAKASSASAVAAVKNAATAAAEAVRASVVGAGSGSGAGAATGRVVEAVGEL